MDVLSVIGTIFIAMLLAWSGAAYFINMGVRIGRSNAHDHIVQTAQKPIKADGFVRRMPGQEAGYIEE